MDKCDEIFKTLEDYDEMTFTLSASSKIGKIMRHIGRKNDLPCKEKFRFQERAKLLAERWSSLATSRTGRYAESSYFGDVGDMSVLSPILHNMKREREMHLGGVGGLNEIIVEHASGRAISVTLPYH